MLELKVKFVNMGDRNCLVETKGKCYEDAKLVKLGGNTPVRTVKVSYRRTFSVGYSDSKAESLEAKYEIIDTYNIYSKAIIRHTEGEKFTLGAYNGYNMYAVEVNGVFAAGGWGEADDRVEIAKRVIEAYKAQ